MKRFELWVQWLKFSGYALVLFGLVMAFLNATPVFALFNDRIDPVFWAGGGIDQGTLAFRTWVYAAWGATIAGWGVSLLFVIQNAFAKQERWSWFAITLGLGLWYVLDTGMSAYFDVSFNVAFNNLILVIIIIPLVASYRYFRSKDNE